MTSVIIIGLLISTLFVIAFVSKRRFGVSALALAAGAMLSSLWVGDLTPLVAEAGLVLVRPPLESVIASAVTLLPALLLLFNGPTYHKASHRAVGSMLFTLFATVLLLEPIEAALILEGVGRQVYDFFVAHQIMIMTACLVVAIGDVLFTKTPKIPSKH